MAEVTGLTELQKQLKEVQTRLTVERGVTYIIGFTQKYALWVHERLNVHHPVGEAKFLENAVRATKDEVVKAVIAELHAGKSLSQALLVGALMIQREAQKRTPVDTGALKNSAFTRREDAK